MLAIKNCPLDQIRAVICRWILRDGVASPSHSLVVRKQIWNRINMAICHDAPLLNRICISFVKMQFFLVEEITFFVYVLHYFVNHWKCSKYTDGHMKESFLLSKIKWKLKIHVTLFFNEKAWLVQKMQGLLWPVFYCMEEQMSECTQRTLSQWHEVPIMNQTITSWWSILLKDIDF